MIDDGDRVLGGEGTERSPRYYAGLADSRGEQNREYFAYKSERGLVTGTVTSVIFSVDQPVGVVWPIFKDFNRWQNCYRHYYSGVIGDLEGGTFRLTEGTFFADYNVVRVVPPYLIVLSQLVAKEGDLAGMGGVMVFSLNHQGAGTGVNIFIQHERTTGDLPEKDAVAYWKESAHENQKKWREYFIPELKTLARTAAANAVST